MIDRPAVDLYRAVVGPQVSAFGQLLRQPYLPGDLQRRISLVGQQQGLVVNPAVGRRCVAEEGLRRAGLLLRVPVGPVVRLKYHVQPSAPAHQGVCQIPGPGRGVPHLGAPDGIEVMEGPIAQLRHPEGPVCWEIVDHLHRCLRLRRQHEFHRQAVKLQRTVVVDIDRRPDKGGMSRGLGQPNSRGYQIPLSAVRPMAAHLVLLPAGHGMASVDVLPHHLCVVTRRDVDGDLRPQPGRVCHAAHAAVVVQVGVADDHGPHPGRDLLPQRLLGKGHGRSGRLHIGHAVQHDPAGGRADQRQIGQIKAPYLVDFSRHHLEQSAEKIGPAVEPEAGIYSVIRPGLLQKGESPQVPYNVSLRVPDHHILRASNLVRRRQQQFQALRGLRVQAQLLRQAAVGRPGLLCGRFWPVCVDVSAHGYSAPSAAAA